MGKEDMEKGHYRVDGTQKLREMFGFDIRSLALYRIGLGIITIGDLMERSLDLRAHYSDEGIFPRNALFESFSNNYTIHIHAMCGHPYWIAFCFIVHALLALSLLVGYRTRTCTALIWLFLVSLQARNIFLNHGGDLYFRLQFFYAIFLPLGGAYSVDAAIAASQTLPKPRNPRVLTGGTLACLCQVALMYGVSTFHKTGHEWTHEYTSAWFAIQLDYYKTAFAIFVSQFHTLLNFLTWAVFKWEWYGTFCIFMPVYTDYFRILAVLGFFAMHLGFVMCLRLGFFFYVCTVCLFPLIPTLVWDWIFNTRAMREAAMRSHTITVRFDQRSRFSKLVAYCVCTFMGIPFSRLASLSHDAEMGAMMGSKAAESVRSDVWLEVEGDYTTQNFRALKMAFANSPAYPPTYPIRKVCEMLTPLWVAVHYKAACVFDPIGNSVSDACATQCHKWHHNTLDGSIKPHPASPPKQRPPIKIGHVFILFCVCLALSWNMGNLNIHPHLPYSWNWITVALHMDQFWGMFSPHPPKAHWFYVIEAERGNGDKFNLWQNEGIFRLEGTMPLTFTKADPYPASFKNHRWYKFFEMGMNHENYDNVRLGFGRYLCREYNAKHEGDQRLHRYQVWYMLEWQSLYGGRTAPTKNLLWDHVCYVK